MKLNQEGVEKAAEASYRIVADCIGDMQPWESLPELRKQQFIEEQAAALTAYFDHLREAGLMRVAMGYRVDGDEEWSAMTTFPSLVFLNGFPCLILRTEKE